MTQTLAERINEIRRNKQVSVQTIVANGISKSKYFAYMRGERDLSIVDSRFANFDGFVDGLLCGVGD